MEIFAENFIVGIAWLLKTVLDIYFWIVIASVVFSWINPAPYNPVIMSVVNGVRSLTEPVLYRIRKTLPFTYSMGLDFSPMLLILGIQFVQMVVVRTLMQIGSMM